MEFEDLIYLLPLQGGVCSIPCAVGGVWCCSAAAREDAEQTAGSGTQTLCASEQGQLIYVPWTWGSVGRAALQSKGKWRENGEN